MSIAAVVLAAGEASRFGTPKQRLLLPEVLERLEQSPVDDIVVVAGAHTLETPARVVTCAGWKRGPGASLSAGLEELGDDVEAAIVVLADGPDLVPETVGRVIEAWRADGGTDRCRVLRRRARPPAPRRARGWGSIPDGGLRELDARLVPCDDLGAPGDVNTPADLPAPACARARWRRFRQAARPERSCASFAISSGGMRSAAVVCTYWRSDTSKRYRRRQ